jgi:hypothetical protein
MTQRKQTKEIVENYKTDVEAIIRESKTPWEEKEEVYN